LTGVFLTKIKNIASRTTAKDVGGTLQLLLLPLADLIGALFKLSHSCAKVLSFRNAASAMRALNAAIWVHRIRRADFLTIKNSYSSHHTLDLKSGVFTDKVVEICGTTSLHSKMKFMSSFKDAILISAHRNACTSM
jgi:hypothetical protein